MSRDTYHHGDLKAVILAKAAGLVADRGADGISLRELAREAGVSHAAPAHHFTDRRGLFTALAAQAWRMLADALAGARPDFIEAALAYVRFALDHPGHYAVMFDRSLVDPDDQDLKAAQDAAGAELAQGVGTLKDPRANADPRTDVCRTRPARSPIQDTKPGVEYAFSEFPEGTMPDYECPRATSVWRWFA